MKIIVKVQW